MDQDDFVLSSFESCFPGSQCCHFNYVCSVLIQSLPSSVAENAFQLLATRPFYCHEPRARPQFVLMMTPRLCTPTEMVQVKQSEVFSADAKNFY